MNDQKKLKNNFSEKINNPKNKKCLISLIICIEVLIIAISVIILVSKNDRLTKKEMLEVLPNSVVAVQIDEKWIDCKVESFEIIQRKTGDDRDEVYSEIVLLTDCLRFTTYRKLDFVRYKRNEWGLSNYSTCQDTKVEILKTPAELYSQAIESIAHYDDRYGNIDNFIEDYSVAIENRQISYAFDIDKSDGILNVSGTVLIDYHLRGSVDAGYFWDYNIDDSGVRKKWNVEGTWYGYCTNFGTGMYELTLDIESLVNDNIVLDWTWNYDGSIYSGDQSNLTVLNSDEEMIEFMIKYDPKSTALSTYLTFTLYTDGNSSAEKPFLGNWLMNKQ